MDAVHSIKNTVSIFVCVQP